jgi:hypothetical protein
MIILAFLYAKYLLLVPNGKPVTPEDVKILFLQRSG